MVHNPMDRQIKRLVIHCSDSEFGTADLIKRWHKERGWKDIGYNLVVLNALPESGKMVPENDGRIEVGRGLNFDSVISTDEVGAHSLGYNQSSIGVCLIGKQHFSERQMDSLLTVVKLWRAIIPDIIVCGHRDLDLRKTCPNFDVSAWLKSHGIESGL